MHMQALMMYMQILMLRSTVPFDKLSVIMTDPIDIQEIVACTCLRARRATRRMTQIYDDALEPVHLTINQFGVLSYLYGSTLAGNEHLAVGVLADRVGKHPTTLNRDLKPLEALGFVTSANDPTDRRVRAVQLTSKGRNQLRKAVPYWRRAETQIREKLGVESMHALNRLLDHASAKLGK
jgi:DNA-binding MarR family transcriptional regulator